MEMRSILILAGVLATTAVAAEAYRWVDENGVVTYSDRQEPGAERIDLQADLPPPNTYSAPTAAQATNNTDSEQSAAARPSGYESLSISNPGAEVTLWDIGGVLDVSLSLSPGLQANHQVRVYLDGGPAQRVSGTSFQIEEVYRGVHNIQAEVIDQTGRLIIRSQPNRFYVQQNVIRR
jgi:hypothetical protein